MQHRPQLLRISTRWIALAAAGAAVLLWGCLPALRLMIGDQPPFLTATIALVAASLMETLRSWGVTLRHHELDNGRRPLSVGRGLGLSVGLIGAIGFYFIGLDRGPAAPITLITYVWPLMFVVASELLDTGRLRAVVIGGGAVAFAGSAVLILGTSGDGLTAGQILGYLAGICSGASWVVYSLMLKRGGPLGPDAWPRIFTMSAVGAGICHVTLEPVTLSFDPLSFAVAAAIGLGPYGIAFVAWAYGVSNGPARTIGTMAYGVPVVATGILAILGAAELSWMLALGAVLVIIGIVLSGQQGAPYKAIESTGAIA